ncbi:AAA family ATPase [Pseudomonas nunensis]|uniref:AAA family ATPase n=1 Tax=Pseudomonas nunensis TaxID=2961896 RepID=UPI0006B66BDF|nr:AAA family ATPase [Pseudomonas nunensis]KOY01625.1 hypothetical protein AM274_16030 [Pseudomonas nunensis]
MRFMVSERGQGLPSSSDSFVVLIVDNWNDHRFVTMFHSVLVSGFGERYELGQVKIAFQGQEREIPTHSQLPGEFEVLGSNFFSLGTSVEYYKNVSRLPSPMKDEYLMGLRDVVAYKELLNKALVEEVFNVSLLREIGLNSVRSQFKRVLRGGNIHVDYSFSYLDEASDGLTRIRLDFDVNAESSPPNNIHAIIGRNGVGKTTVLNKIVESVRGNISPKLYQRGQGGIRPLYANYFSGAVLVSFSAFDPFEPPVEQLDRTAGAFINYIGLKVNAGHEGHLKSREQLRVEFYSSLRACLKDSYKKIRWVSAIQALEFDDNFKDVGLVELLQLDGFFLEEQARRKFWSLSSGHAIVLLSITKLVEVVEEKTLVLIDEPESHLHPPLLSAYVRALSELLSDRNGLAILATHSPVVLQEIPRSCVWNVDRRGVAMSARRPEIETFGENVGVLTREAFGLEGASAGYHTLLAAAVAEGLNYHEIMVRFDGRLGYEAQAVLRALISNRDSRS